MQITLEIPGPAEGSTGKTVTVEMDGPPVRGDRIVLTGADGQISYRVRRQAWRIHVRRDIYGEVVAHSVQLEPDGTSTPPAAAPEPAATASRARRAKVPE